MAQYEAIVSGDLNHFLEALNEATANGEYHVVSSNAYVEDGATSYYALIEKPVGLWDWKANVLEKLERIESNTDS